jgi:hypothetical protein
MIDPGLLRAVEMTSEDLNVQLSMVSDTGIMLQLELL